MNWAPRHSSYSPQQRAPYMGYRPSYGALDRRGWEHRKHYRRPYPGFGYIGYPYPYTNSWELIPWDLGSPDFTDDDNNGAANEDQNDMQIQSPYYEEQPPSQEDWGYRPDYGSPPPCQSSASQEVAPTPPQNEPKLTLVFKDGSHTGRSQLRAYTREIIVMDDVASGKTQRIALAALNLLVTQEAAHQAGLNFASPTF